MHKTHCNINDVPELYVIMYILRISVACTLTVHCNFVCRLKPNWVDTKFKGETNLDSTLKQFYLSSANIQCHRDRCKRATGHLLPFSHQLL